MKGMRERLDFAYDVLVNGCWCFFYASRAQDYPAVGYDTAWKSFPQKKRWTLKTIQFAHRLLITPVLAPLFAVYIYDLRRKHLELVAENEKLKHQHSGKQ